MTSGRDRLRIYAMDTNNLTAKSSISERITALVNELSDGNNTEFGRRIGESEANVRNFRNGKTTPKFRTLSSIVVCYGISAEWLLTGEGEMTKTSGGHTEFVGKEQLERQILELKEEKMQLLEEVVRLQKQLLGQAG